MPVLLLQPGNAYFAGLDDKEEVLLQGVVDLFAIKDGAVTVVDFKTDFITEKTLEEKVSAYRPQLAAYSAALEQILDMPVISRVLYFFRTGQTVEI